MADRPDVLELLDALIDGMGGYLHPMTCPSMDGWEETGEPCACFHGRNLQTLRELRLALLSGEEPARRTVEQQLDHLQTLGANWDSYGAVPITPEALAAARTWLARLYVWPRSNGGLQLGWDEDGQDVLIAPDGSFEGNAERSGEEPAPPDKSPMGLLRCPWCGEFPQPMNITSGDDGKEIFRGIFCMTPSCAVRPYLDAATVGGDSSNARFRWNQRAERAGADHPHREPRTEQELIEDMKVACAFVPPEDVPQIIEECARVAQTYIGPATKASALGSPLGADQTVSWLVKPYSGNTPLSDIAAMAVDMGDPTLSETFRGRADHPHEPSPRVVAELCAALEPLLDNAMGYDSSTVRAAFRQFYAGNDERRSEMLALEERARLAWQAARAGQAPQDGRRDEQRIAELEKENAALRELTRKDSPLEADYATLRVWLESARAALSEIAQAQTAFTKQVHEIATDGSLALRGRGRAAARGAGADAT